MFAAQGWSPGHLRIHFERISPIWMKIGPFWTKMGQIESISGQLKKPRREIRSSWKWPRTCMKLKYNGHDGACILWLGSLYWKLYVHSPMILYFYREICGWSLYFGNGVGYGLGFSRVMSRISLYLFLCRNDNIWLDEKYRLLKMQMF